MKHWKEILRENFSNWVHLANYLEFEEKNRKLILQSPHFPLKLPLRIAKKIQKNSLTDPLLKQFLPTHHENEDVEGFSIHPVNDPMFQKEKKLLHKYQDRALLLVTSACAMHCRFCFRQNFPYESHIHDYSKEIKYIQKNTQLREIIFSGGDPLSLDDSHLKNLFTHINKISHIERVRFHTRFPIGIPERIDNSFLETLTVSQKQIFFTLHINHPKEWDEDIAKHIKYVQKLGIPVLSQTVLLRDVNDEIDTLRELFEVLTGSGIIPYYLHQLDPVKGSAHFNVLNCKGSLLTEQLRSQISGYAVPRFVQELPGKPSKTLIL